jgi:ribonuclease HI
MTYQMKNNKLHLVHQSTATSAEPIEIPKQLVPAIFTLTKQTLYSERRKPEVTKEHTTNNESSQQTCGQKKEFSGQLLPKVIIETDASVHQEKAAFAWIIATTNGKVIVHHSARIKEENISSYQAELFEILNAIIMLQNHIFEVQQWIVYCDNQALVERLQSVQLESEIPSEWKDSDIIESILTKSTPKWRA